MKLIHTSLFYLLTLLLFMGCNASHREAMELYTRAEQALSHKDYNRAQQLLDSIPIVAPQATSYIRRGIELNQRVILERNRDNIAYIDSILPEMRAQEQALRSAFIAIQNPEYHDDTIFIHRDADHTVFRSHLRIEMTATGEVRLHSVYYGKEELNHTSAKIEHPDGTYALTPTIPYDSAQNHHFVLPDGTHCEMVCYRNYEIRPVIEALGSGGNKTIKISYAGDRPYSYILSESDREIFKTFYQYIFLHHTIDRIERNREYLQRSVDLITSRHNSPTNTPEYPPILQR